MRPATNGFRPAIPHPAAMWPGRVSTPICACANNSVQRCQVGNPANASAPTSNTSGRSSPISSRNSTSVSIVYDGPARRSSRMSSVNRSCPASAARTSAARVSASATGCSRCGGTFAGSRRTSAPRNSAASHATRRCALWIGSNVPPKIASGFTPTVPPLCGARQSPRRGVRIRARHRRRRGPWRCGRCVLPARGSFPSARGRRP